MSDLLLGLGLGLGAGITPGPMLSLVLSTALQRGFAAGLRTACSPLVTDAPIIVLALLVVGSLPAAVVSGLAVAGGLLVVWLGVDAIRAAPSARLEVVAGPADRRDLWRGALVNLLNPHPWLFWAAAGAPLLVAGWRRGPGHVAAFLLGFYGLLVGAKIALAWLVASGRRRLTIPWYRRLLGATGGLLVVTGLALIRGFLDRP